MDNIERDWIEFEGMLLTATEEDDVICDSCGHRVEPGAYFIVELTGLYHQECAGVLVCHGASEQGAPADNITISQS